jgi:hypothetical protein
MSLIQISTLRTSTHNVRTTLQLVILFVAVVAVVWAPDALARRKKKTAPAPTSLATLTVQVMPVPGVAGGDALVAAIGRALRNRGAAVSIGPDGTVADLVIDNVVAKGTVKFVGRADGNEVFAVSVKRKPKRAFAGGVVPVIDAVERVAPALLAAKENNNNGGGGGSFNWDDPAGLKKKTPQTEPPKTPEPPATPEPQADDDDDDASDDDGVQGSPDKTDDTNNDTNADVDWSVFELRVFGGSAAWNSSYAEAEGTATLPAQSAPFIGGGLQLTVMFMPWLGVDADYDSSGVFFAIPAGDGIVVDGDPPLSLQHRASAALLAQTALVDDGLLTVGARVGYRLWMGDGAQGAKIGDLDVTFIPSFTLHAPVLGAMAASTLGPVRLALTVDVAPWAIYSEAPDVTGEPGLNVAGFSTLSVAIDIGPNAFVVVRGDASYLRAETVGAGTRVGFIGDDVVVTGGGVIEMTRLGAGLGAGFRF